MLRLASSRVPQLRVWRKAPVIARIVVASLSRHLRDQSLSAGSKPGSIHADAPSFSTVAANTDSASASMSRVRSLYKSTHKARSLTSDVDAGVRETLPAAANIAANLAAGRSSCAEDGGSVPDRPLTALQRRQLLFKNKAAFVLAPNALRRVEYLLAQYAAKVKGEGLTDTQVSDGNVSGGGNVCMDRGASSHDNMTRDEVCAGKKPSLSKPPLPVGIRIGVRRRGCSGYSYTVNYYFAPPESNSVSCAEDSASTARSSTVSGGVGNTARRGSAARVQDVIVDQSGVKVVVDGNALFYVIGTTMDYVVRDVEEKFVFMNPNQKFSCGCEESFMPFGSDDLDED